MTVAFQTVAAARRGTVGSPESLTPFPGSSPLILTPVHGEVVDVEELARGMAGCRPAN